MATQETKASSQAWFNGKIIEREDAAPSVASISFHLGTGVFDGMMAYWNRDHFYLHRGQEHLQRFLVGASRMGMPIQWTIDELTSGILALLALQPRADLYVRPIVYRKAPELWVTGSEGRPVDVCIFTVCVARDSDELITCHISPVERLSSRSVPQQTKISGTYVNSFHARKSAELAGFHDGIMLDREGRIAEASAANFFAVVDNYLLTPALNSDVFPGITRAVVLDIAEQLRIPYEVRDLRPQDIRDAQAAFLCSTLMEIRGISQLDDAVLKTQDNETFRRIVCAFRQLTHQ